MGVAWLAITAAVCIVAVAVEGGTLPRRDAAESRTSPAYIPAGVLLLLAAVLLMVLPGEAVQPSTAGAVLVGGVLVLLALVLEQSKAGPLLLTPLALGCLGGLTGAFLPPPHWLVGLVLGAGLAAGAAGTSNYASGYRTAVILAAQSALVLLVAARGGLQDDGLPILAALAASLIGLLLHGLKLAGQQRLAPALAGLLLGGVALVLAATAGLPGGPLMAALLPLTGWGLFLLLSEDSPVTPAYALGSGLLAIALGGLLFGIAAGTGIALMALLLVVMALLCGRSLALLASLPLLALAWHRVAQEYATVGQIIEPNQHYVLLGLCLGALLPVLLASDAAGDETVPGGGWRWIPTALLALLILWLIPSLLSLRAAGAALSGLALAPVIALLPRHPARATGAMVGVCAAGLLLSLLVRQAGMTGLLTRDDKVQVLLIALAIAVVLLLPRLIPLLKPAARTEEPA